MRRSDPGRPDVCNVYSLHKLFSTEEDVATVHEECTTAQRGCVDCKRHLASSVNAFLEPLRERRRVLEEQPDYVREILLEGGRKARSIAQETIGEVYEKMGLGLPV